MQNDRFYFRIVANTMQMVPGKNIEKLPKTILHHLNHHQSRCVQEVFLCKCRCAISIIHPNFCSLWPNVGLCWLYTTPYGSLVVVITNVFCLHSPFGNHRCQILELVVDGKQFSPFVALCSAGTFAGGKFVLSKYVFLERGFGHNCSLLT